MAFPVGTPYAGTTPNPAYSGVFIPTLWAGKLIEKFYDATVLAGIANTDYAGEISSMGDKVIIRTKPTVTITAYQADEDLGAPQRPSSASVELLIDKGYKFNTVLDDVMEIQADLDMLSMWSDDASEQMKITVDTNALVSVVAGADANNSGTTAGVRSASVNLGGPTAQLVLDNTTDSVTETIIGAGQCLDEYNIPEQGRWMVIPAWLAANIKKSELRDASLTGDGTSMLRNGRLGMIDRFTLYMSNLLPTATEAGTDPHEIPFGHSTGFTFASQMTKMETLRAESTFGTILRGLQVCGWKVTDSTAIGKIYASAKA